MTLTLTNEQLSNLDKEGYLVVDDVINPTTVLDPLIKEYESVLDNLAHELFIRQFKHGQLPDDIEIVSVKISEVESKSGNINIPKVLYVSTLVNSVTEGHRAIEAGSVRLEGEKIENSQLKLDLKTKHIFSIGKRRFVKVEFN